MIPRVVINRLATGVPGLDEVLGGGLPEFSFNLIAGPPGSGKTTLAHQMMFALATEERRRQKTLRFVWCPAPAGRPMPTARAPSASEAPVAIPNASGRIMRWSVCIEPTAFIGFPSGEGHKRAPLNASRKARCGKCSPFL